MPPMTILLGCDTFYPDVNGATRFTERLAAGLVARGHEVHVVTPATGDTEPGTRTEVIEGQPMIVHRFPSVRWYAHPWLRYTWPTVSRRLSAQAIEDIRPDVVHIQSHIMNGRYLLRALRGSGIRVIATNHTMPENVLDHTGLPGPLNRLFASWAWHDIDRQLSQAARVTTPTRNAADYLEAKTSIRDVIPVSNGIDASRYTPDFTARAENRVLFVGRVEHEKHIDVLIRALALLPADLDVRLDIVGDGDVRKSLHHLAQRLGVEDRVAFHGWASDEELKVLYTHASLFAIASIAELQSIATMEAMSSGLPIVAADAMALPHLVEDGVNGWLFPPGDAQAAADRIERVLRLDPAARRAMQEASIAGVRVHDLSHTLDVFEALYRGDARDSSASDRNESSSSADFPQS